MKDDVFLVDTNVWIEYFRRNRKRKNLSIIKTVNEFERNGRVVSCGIILAEFVQGLGKSFKELSARRILESHEFLSSSKEIYILAGELSRYLAEKGFKTPLSDCLIAAQVISYGIVLVTNDPHFKRFKELKLIFLE